MTPLLSPCSRAHHLHGCPGPSDLRVFSRAPLSVAATPPQRRGRAGRAAVHHAADLPISPTRLRRRDEGWVHVARGTSHWLRSNAQSITVG